MVICILGATGLVGGELLTLIARAWPKAELRLYASRDQELEHAGRKLQVHAASRLEEDSSPGGDLAFVALDDAFSARYVPRLLELGYRVIDKSNTYRLHKEVPLVVAGVNSHQVVQEQKLIANPNCTTIPLSLALAPLAKKWGLKSATVSSYQAISGAGQSALDSFLKHNQASYAEADRIGIKLDPKAYTGNTVPHNGGTDESGFSSEERKLVNESRKILNDPSFAISAQCCRVPVAVGHYENAWIELKSKAPLPEIVDLLNSQDHAPFIRFIPGAEGEGLSALATVHHRDLALVGRLRRDPRDPEGRSICLSIAADNLRLGAATNAVRIASSWYPSADSELQVTVNP